MFVFFFILQVRMVRLVKLEMIHKQMLDSLTKGKEKQVKVNIDASSILESEGCNGHFKLENSTPMEAKSELEDEMEACWTISNLTAGNMEQIQLSDKVMEYGVTALRILNQVLMLQVSPLIIFYQMRWKLDC
ncbi:hypothetical protein LXL04_032785 [Taraxacum kok-saghyz]